MWEVLHWLYSHNASHTGSHPWCEGAYLTGLWVPGQFGATIRLGQFVSDNSAQNTILILFKVPFSFSNILFINPTSISARFSSSILLLFQQYFFINPASISAIFFSPISFGTRHYELGLLIDEKILLKWKWD